VATASGTFDIELRAATGEAGGALVRHDFAKTFSGELEGHAVGLMISAGDPVSGAAGYVAMEVVTGTLGGQRGTFALQQYGTMSGGSQRLEYEIVPGSGDRELQGITGRLELRVEDGAHHYVLDYEL
jgi:hypothetical protein